MNYDKFHSKTSAQKKIIRDNNFTYRHLVGVINKYIRTGDKVLDIGCGAGTLSLYLASKNHKILGIDISNKAIKDATESARLLGLKNTKFQSMNFPSKLPAEKFDFIIFTEVIEHLRDDQLAIDKINKLLNSGGRLLISTPSINAPLHRIGYSRGFDKRVGHLRRYSEDNLAEVLIANDLKILEVKKIEGLMRNFMFLSEYAGNFVRVLNHSSIASSIFTAVDNMFVALFGNSNIIIIAKKK